MPRDNAVICTTKMKTSILFILIILMTSCVGKVKVDEKEDPFAALRADISGLANTSIDTLYLSRDTIRLKIVDSISWTQHIEEGMINSYILHRIVRSNPHVKRIVVEKRYPNREQPPTWQMDLNVVDIESLIKPFDDALFSEIAEYLLKLPNSRTGASVLLIFNTRWAILKNGDLEKSWAENSFEILFAFCKECEEGKANDYFLAMERLNSMEEKMSITEKREIEKVFEIIFSKCKNQKIKRKA
jgi:hypothetical protein